MSKHPLNMAIRFALEVAAIITYGIWGYRQTDGGLRILLAFLLPLLFAVLWGVFAVPNDPSRSGKTVIATPGLVRLILELGMFGSAVWMLFDLGLSVPAWIFGVAVLVHYISSYDRIFWLLKKKIS